MEGSLICPSLECSPQVDAQNAHPDQQVHPAILGKDATLPLPLPPLQSFRPALQKKSDSSISGEENTPGIDDSGTLLKKTEIGLECES